MEWLLERTMATTICPSCIQGYRLAGEPTGEMVSVGDQQAYVRSGTTQGQKAVVILPDAFGLPIPNAQIIADRFSEKLGIDVYVPDIYHGAPIPFLRIVTLIYVCRSTTSQP